MKATDILKPLVLRKGAGGSFDNGLCVMEAVSWLGGETCSDTPQCACPELGRFAVRLNDILSNENRQKLIPLAFDMLGTRSKEHEKIRAEFLVIQVARRIISVAFDKINLPDFANEYKNVKTLEQVREVSLRAKKAAYAAAGAAGAAGAAAHAYATAYDAAYAYAGACQEMLLLCIPILQEAIALGPNGKIDDVVLERAVRLSEFVSTPDLVPS